MRLISNRTSMNIKSDAPTKIPIVQPANRATVRRYPAFSRFLVLEYLCMMSWRMSQVILLAAYFPCCFINACRIFSVVNRLKSLSYNIAATVKLNQYLYF